MENLFKKIMLNTVIISVLMMGAHCSAEEELLPEKEEEIIAEEVKDGDKKEEEEKKDEAADNYDSNYPAIKIYEENNSFWQYDGKPIMLLGGSKDDNLFQVTNLESHLDEMVAVGGNYVRNTMSCRDEGNLQPFGKTDGKYDLSKWNEEYWKRFSNFLKWTEERQIFVQIEIWAFHDFYGEWSEFLAWNPKHNINYSENDTQLQSEEYGSYWETVHDFFLTIPELNNDIKVLKYQQAFVDKLLSYSLRHNNVLYCITNEIFTQYPPEWGWYWSGYLKTKANEKNKQIYVTEMYQNHDVKEDQHKASFDHPETYDFVDISQNSRQTNERHWNRLQYVRDYLKNEKRPINHTKTYGGDEVDWTHGDAHGIECFWRSIVGGAASIRFHRPTSGIGLSHKAKSHLKSARMLLEQIDIFRSQPDTNHELLSDRSGNEAYLTYIPEQSYAVYFPDKGLVDLDLGNASGIFELKWLDIRNSKWQSVTTVSAGKKIKLEVPGSGANWAVVLNKKN